MQKICTENAFVNVINDTLAGLFPNDPPAFMARTPHGYHYVDMIGSELRAAGFISVKVETLQHMAKASSPREVATAYCQGTPLRSEIEARDSSGLERVTALVAEALAEKFGGGAMEGRISAHVVTASC